MALSSLVQSVTHSLPAPVHAQLRALLGSEKCYQQLLVQGELTSNSTGCLSLALSKALGLAIVLGSSVVKVPQIIKIVRAQQAKGLSFTAYALDTASVLVTVAYNARHGFPFSTYGENAFLLVQNVIILILILFFSSRASRRAPLTLLISALILGASYALATPSWVPDAQLRTLALGLAIPLSLAGKVPQIVALARARSTGQLSAVLVFASLAGTLARVFTTATETGDSVMWYGYALSAALNAVIAAQMLLFWADTPSPAPSSSSKPVDVGVATTTPRAADADTKRYAAAAAAEKPKPALAPRAAPATPRAPSTGSGATATPTTAASGGGGRSASGRYVRKLD